ncbi:MAG: glycosyltransferase [Cyclobacteriaceae bacterium]
MRVCIARSEPGSYSETFIRDQLNGFARLAEVRSIHTSRLPERSEEGALLSPWPFWIIHKVIKAVTGKRNNYFSHFGLKKFLIGYNIDVVVANYGLTAAHLAPICREVNIPIIAIFHGHDAGDKKLLKQYRKNYATLFEYAHTLVAVSHDIRNKLIALGADPGKVQVISCGVDTEKFKPSSQSREKIFLSVGRLVEKKGPLYTIRAFHEVWKKHPDAQLVMAGAHTGLYAACKKLTESLDMQDSVLFPGILNHDQVQEWMNRSFAFVQHSLTACNGDTEGTPVGILEASATGLPVVSTLHGGIPQAVVHGVTGYLVKEGDVAAMATYMNTLLEDEHMVTRMREAARKHVAEHYEQENQINRLFKVAAQAVQSK